MAGLRPCLIACLTLLAYSRVVAYDAPASNTPAAKSSCPDDMFQCKSGRCIPKRWLCDEDSDCEDGDDEEKTMCQSKAMAPRCDQQSEYMCAPSSRPMGPLRAALGITSSLFSQVCIPKGWLCDGEYDCPGKDDELNCKDIQCKSDQFKCPGINGNSETCIPQSWLCDGQVDCADGADENRTRCDQSRPASLKCDVSTPTHNGTEFMCGKGHKCIFHTWVCDGDDDCGDNSDEQNCTNTSDYNDNTRFFKCKTVQYVLPKSWQCDGELDCSDGSDEEGCDKYTPVRNVTCKPTDFTCASRAHCVSSEWVCDGDRDCPDGSDEVDCAHKQPECPKGHRSCGITHICRPESDFCNGVNDCPEGTDEIGCRNPPAAANASVPCDPDREFECPGSFHQCIRYADLCTGAARGDCVEKVCQSNRFLGTCNATATNPYCTCHPNYNTDGQVCYCPKGFESIGGICKDIDECETPGACDQICHNLPGTYRCECHPHYHLTRQKPEDAIATRCRATGADPLILLSNRAAIRQYDLATNKYYPLVNQLESAVAMDYWHENATLIWSDVSKEQIMMCKLSNTSWYHGVHDCVGNTTNTTLLDSDVATVDGLAVDWVHGNLYFTDTASNKISVLDLKTRRRRVVIDKGLDEPRAIALDPSRGLIFWTDWGSKPRIERAGMDGEDRMEILSGNGVRWPNGLAIDILDQRLYWADAKTKMISSCDYYGRNVRTVLHSSESLRHPFSLAVFEERLYWTDWDKEGVLTVNKFRGDDVNVLLSGISGPMTVRVYHRLAQPENENKCKRSGCKHMCLPRAHIRATESSLEERYVGLPYACVCPIGMTSSASDMSDCVPLDTVLDELTGGSRAGGGSRFSLAFFIFCLMVATLALAGYVWHSRRTRPFHVLQFDNPIYRRTTEDPDSVEFGANGGGDGIGSSGANTLGAIPSDTAPPPAVQSRLVLSQPMSGGDTAAAAHLTANDFYHPSNYAYEQPLPSAKTNAESR